MMIFFIQLVQQPPNSPDMNVLDLGFFSSILALQYHKAAYNVPKLLSVVNNAFDNLSSQCLRFVFITLQACMIETSDGHRASYPEPKPFATSSEPGNRETTGKKLPEPDLRTAGRNRNRSR